MNWEEFLREGKLAEEKVRNGLLRRGFNAGESIRTQFNTDEDIPIYDKSGQKLFWISVKSNAKNILTLEQARNFYKRGWMCGEVESKQWVYPPAIIIWVGLKFHWGAITPKRPSTEWYIFPAKHGLEIDERKTRLTGETHFIYPSYHVPGECLRSKDDIIAYIQNLCGR